MSRAAALVLWAGAASADGVQRADYATLDATLSGRFNFEMFEPRPEPGFSIDGLLSDDHIRLGEAFAGQRVGGTLFDQIEGDPTPYPTALPGTPGRNLAIAYHAGFGSVALFPLGPKGHPAIEALGEGSLAIGFRRPVTAFGLRIHADYADPLGSRPAPGELRLRFYGAEGTEIGQHRVPLDHGITELGFTAPGIVGVLITNTDPGGIAVDDIIYPIPGLSS